MGIDEACRIHIASLAFGEICMQTEHVLTSVGEKAYNLVQRAMHPQRR
jgi:hypothetical protein